MPTPSQTSLKILLFVFCFFSTLTQAENPNKTLNLENLLPICQNPLEVTPATPSGFWIKTTNGTLAKIEIRANNGDLINTLEANYPTYYWDGLDADKKPIKSGIYLVTSTNTDGDVMSKKIIVL